MEKIRECALDFYNFLLIGEYECALENCGYDGDVSLSIKYSHLTELFSSGLGKYVEYLGDKETIDFYHDHLFFSSLKKMSNWFSADYSLVCSIIKSRQKE